MNVCTVRWVWRILKGYSGSEVNAIAAKTSVKASLLSLHEKPYPSLLYNLLDFTLPK